MGLALYHLHHHDEEAIKAYQRAIELGLRDVDVLGIMGLALCRLGQYKEALVVCDEAIGLKEDKSHPHVGRGNALLGLGRYEEALKEFEYAIKLAPCYKAAYTGKAEAHECLARLYHQKAADL